MKFEPLSYQRTQFRISRDVAVALDAENIVNFVDLCCGAGGLSLGFGYAGMTPTAAFDSWAVAVSVYNENVGQHAFTADLGRPQTLVPVIARLMPDLIAGGPPCQDYSAAGNRREGARAYLTIAFAETVVALKPRWFVFENVLGASGSESYRTARTLFTRAGFGLTEIILDASECGVPQRRKRFFCIGRLGACHQFLVQDLQSGKSARPMTVRDYLSDELGLEHYYRHPRRYDRRAVFSIDEPALTIRGTNRRPAPGYSRHLKDSASPGDVRALTFHERSRIQTFPSNWVWRGRTSEIEQMIGNAVPPLLARYVGRRIMTYERRHPGVAVASAPVSALAA